MPVVVRLDVIVVGHPRKIPLIDQQLLERRACITAVGL